MPDETKIKIFNVQALLQQGIAAFQQNDIQKTLEIADELISHNASNDEAYHLKGVALYIKKDFIESEKYLRKAISLNQKKSYFFNSLGITLNEQRRFEEAVDYLKQAINLDPNNVTIYNSLGVAFKELELFDKAMYCYNAAISLNPNYAQTHMNIGVLKTHLERYDEAIEHHKTALKLNPNDPLIYVNMAAALRKAGKHGEAIEYNKKSLEMKSDLYESWNNLCATYYEMGEYDKAVEEYTKLVEKYPSDGAKVDLMLLTKQSPESIEEIDGIRKRLNDNIDYLMTQDLHVKNPVKDIQHMHFFHAYHGRNDKELMIKFARLYEKVCPELLYTAPHCRNYRQNNKRKIRVGFISSYFFTHVVSKFFNVTISSLAKDKDFEVIAFSAALKFDEESKKLASQVHKFVRIPLDVFKAREAIAREECDIIAYTDIGMNLITYFLGFARLAPVQCVLSGHPITTGIKNIDYYVSTKIVEPENAQEHYSEKLITFEKNCAVFPKIKMPETMKSRKELGIPEGDNLRIYTCPVYPHKLHPEFDDVIKEILEKDTKARVILFRLQQEIVKLIPTRLSKKLSPELMKRVIFLPHKDYFDFLNFLMEVDCILDPFHFSMGSTAFAVFGVGRPLVTLEGEFMRGRAAYWLYKRMGIEELIAYNRSEYVNLAIKLATDKEWRGSIADKIKQRSNILYEDYSSLDELKAFFKDSLKKAA